RGPRLSLVGGIDDGTGKVVGAIFREQEDQEGYMLMLRQVVEQYGCPQAIYHDRHSMFPTRRKDATEAESVEEQLQGERSTTQLGRLFGQLSITSIAARSPQAKGRIERLWGTFQDRLVSELRLVGACNLEQANAVLQEYLPRLTPVLRSRRQKPSWDGKTFRLSWCSLSVSAGTRSARWPWITRSATTAAAYNSCRRGRAAILPVPRCGCMSILMGTWSCFFRGKPCSLGWLRLMPPNCARRPSLSWLSSSLWRHRQEGRQSQPRLALPPL